MSNPYQARVQQKLSHVRLLMEQLQGRDQLDRQACQAFVQAAVVHLATACRLYLREMGYDLNVVKVEVIFTPEDLVNASPKGLGVAEIASQDWMKDVLAAERRILNPPLMARSNTALRDEVVSPQIIAVDSGAGATEEVTREVLNSWLNAFERLSDRQRQSFVEY